MKHSENSNKLSGNAVAFPKWKRQEIKNGYSRAIRKTATFLINTAMAATKRNLFECLTIYLCAVGMLGISLFANVNSGVKRKYYAEFLK